MKDYCTKNNGNCETCDLRDLTRDCESNKIKDQFIKIVVKNQGEKAETKTVEDTLETWSKIVDGYIEIVSMNINKGTIFIVLNEEGKIKKGYKPNVRWYNDVLMGNLAFVGNGEAGEFRSLTDEEVKEVMQFIVDNIYLGL